MLINPGPLKESFCFELSWIKHDEFIPLAQAIRENLVKIKDHIDILNIKLRRFKKYFKGWGSNAFSHAKKGKMWLEKS